MNFFHENGDSPDGSSGLSVMEVPGSNPDLGGCLESSPDGSSGLSLAEVSSLEPDRGGYLLKERAARGQVQN